MKIRIVSLFVFTLIMSMIYCNQPDSNSRSQTDPSSGISTSYWGNYNNDSIYLYTLENKNGLKVTISNYGGTVTSLLVPDAEGTLSDVVVGMNTLEEYLKHPPYFGALIGRYGNRIGGAKFTLNGTTYQLEANDGKNTLHGGFEGFDKQVWTAEQVPGEEPALILKYQSKDGAGGYPGNLEVTVTYRLTNDNALEIHYEASADKATPVNLTNHSYFNLSGSLKSDILDHELWIDADHYTPVDQGLIPTGEIKPVKGTPFDFTTPKKIGADIDQVEGGYDINMVVSNWDTTLRKIATLSDAASGRQMDVYSTEPGVQFYSGNFLDGRFVNTAGEKIGYRSSLALETQHFPDSPNQPDFPTTILQPGQTMQSTTKYQFSIAK